MALDTYLTMGGVNLRTVQTLLGHKDSRMTMRYSHLSPEHLKEAVSNLDNILNALEEGRQTFVKWKILFMVKLRIAPTSLPPTVILKVDDYDESKHENNFQKIKAEPSDPACSLTIEY